jgi:hypothetical protein
MIQKITTEVLILYSCLHVCTRAICKVRGLTLLLRVGTLWRCGDGLFFEVPPLASDALLTRSTNFSKTCCRSLVTSTFLASEHGMKNPEIAWGEIWIEFYVRLGKMDRWNPIRTSAIQSRSRPMRFIGFSKHWKRSTVCSTFAKEGTLKKRPSPHLHKVPTRSNMVSPRTFQTTLICVCVCIYTHTHTVSQK